MHCNAGTRTKLRKTLLRSTQVSIIVPPARSGYQDSVKEPTMLFRMHSLEKCSRARDTTSEATSRVSWTYTSIGATTCKIAPATRCSRRNSVNKSCRAQKPALVDAPNVKNTGLAGLALASTGQSRCQIASQTHCNHQNHPKPYADHRTLHGCTSSRSIGRQSGDP